MAKTDYQTVVLVREAREVAIEGLDPALRTIVRTALTRDANERYQSALDLADALQGYAASRHLGPTDTALVVREVHDEIRRERLVAPIDPRIADIRAEVARMSSLASYPN